MHVSVQIPSRHVNTAYQSRSFQDAVVTIRRTGIDFQYQLVVTRAYDEGEEQLLEDDAESESSTSTGKDPLKPF